MVVRNAVAVANGKGGVFKTTVTTNVAGLAAAAGWKILVVDTDGQGHAALDFGVVDRSDFGDGLYRSMIEGAPLHIIKDVRPNLDMVAGGERAGQIVAGLAQQITGGDIHAVTSLERALTPIASQYNMILIDTPPGEKLLQQAVMTAVRFVVIPTKADRGSRQGIDRVARDIVKVEPFNTQVEILGVVGVDLPRGSTAMKAKVRARLVEEVGAVAPVFDSFIHTLDMAGVDMRENGLLAHEYEVEAHNQLKKLSIAERIKARKAGKARDFSTGAGKLAGDYETLTDEILTAFTERSALVAEVQS